MTPSGGPPVQTTGTVSSRRRCRRPRPPARSRVEASATRGRAECGARPGCRWARWPAATPRACGGPRRDRRRGRCPARAGRSWPAVRLATLTAPRSSRSREMVAWVASKPWARQLLEDQGLAGHLPGPRQGGQGPLAAAFNDTDRPPRGRAQPGQPLVDLLLGDHQGGARRRAVSVTGLTTRPRPSAPGQHAGIRRGLRPKSRRTTGPPPRPPAPGGPRRGRRRSAGPRWSGRVRRPCSSWSPSAGRVETLSTWPPSSGSITSRVARAAVQATGLPPKVVPWSPRAAWRRRPRSSTMVAPIG